MAKVDFRDVPASERLKMVKGLAKMLRAVKNERDMVQVLYRLFTPSEIVMLGRRKQIAELLISGHSYSEIIEKLKVGLTTIRSVDRWLEEAVGDYDAIRREEKARMAHMRKAKKGRVYSEPDMIGSFSNLKHRMGGAFMLLDLLLDSPIFTNSGSAQKKDKPQVKL